MFPHCEVVAGRANEANQTLAEEVLRKRVRKSKSSLFCYQTKHTPRARTWSPNDDFWSNVWGLRCGEGFYKFGGGGDGITLTLLLGSGGHWFFLLLLDGWPLLLGVDCGGEAHQNISLCLAHLSVVVCLFQRSTSAWSRCCNGKWWIIEMVIFVYSWPQVQVKVKYLLGGLSYNTQYMVFWSDYNFITIISRSSGNLSMKIT